LLGDGPLREDVQRLAQAAPSIRVRFLGFQNQTHLSRYYHAADLLVLPSRHGETWGLVVNEALHHGVPCVVSESVGCAPDLIEARVTGNTFETGSVTTLADALVNAMSLIGRAETRERCRQHVSRYSIIGAARAIAEAYGEVAQGRPVPASHSVANPA
jgi:glycosyltransferase involved in cell wall biosynthesis